MKGIKNKAMLELEKALEARGLKKGAKPASKKKVTKKEK